MRIVCFHLNQVGDLVFSLPALKSLRDTYPDAFITSVVRPHLGEVLSATGLVDKVLYRKRGLNLDKLRLFQEIAGIGFDLAVVLSQSAGCAVLSYAARAPRRVGFVDSSMGWLLTERVSFKHPPSVQNNLRLIETVGCRVTKRDYSGLLRPSAGQIEQAERILASGGIEASETIVAFAPGTSGRRGVKEWTDESFAELGKHLAANGIRIVVLGTQPAYSIVQDCSRILDLSGSTSLGEVAAVLRMCKVLVAVDSGILHLGAAVGTRVVGLYGPSNPDVTGPQGEGHIVVRSGVDCSPCMKTECSLERKCMTSISVSEVIDAVERVMNGGMV